MDTVGVHLQTGLTCNISANDRAGLDTLPIKRRRDVVYVERALAEIVIGNPNQE